MQLSGAAEQVEGGGGWRGGEGGGGNGTPKVHIGRPSNDDCFHKLDKCINC